MVALATEAGYNRGGGYLRPAISAIELAYLAPEIQVKVRTLDAVSLANLPEASRVPAPFVDLEGEACWASSPISAAPGTTSAT
jgi:hypothetical protein